MKSHYSCAELAAMKLPGYPTTARAWLDIAKSEGWEGQKRAGRGGGFEYLPSKTVQALIGNYLVIKARGVGSDVTMTLTVSLIEATYITRWLERKVRRG